MSVMSFFEAHIRQIRKSLSSDGKDFLESERSNFAIQVVEFVVRGFLQLGTQLLGVPASCCEQSVSLGFCRVRGFEEEPGALPLKFVVLMQEIGLLLHGLRFLLFCILQLRRNTFFPFVDGRENGLVKESLQQPHQNEEVEPLVQPP